MADLETDQMKKILVLWLNLDLYFSGNTLPLLQVVTSEKSSKMLIASILNDISALYGVQLKSPQSQGEAHSKENDTKVMRTMINIIKLIREL